MKAEYISMINESVSVFSQEKPTVARTDMWAQDVKCMIFPLLSFRAAAIPCFLLLRLLFLCLFIYPQEGLEYNWKLCEIRRTLNLELFSGLQVWVCLASFKIEYLNLYFWRKFRFKKKENFIFFELHFMSFLTHYFPNILIMIFWNDIWATQSQVQYNNCKI